MIIATQVEQNSAYWLLIAFVKNTADKAVFLLKKFLGELIYFNSQAIEKEGVYCGY